ncbi:MAG: hypothetical protein J6N19_03810 [Clostridium sp.]|nr:hypothetical protein [Clostridium sp.]
MQINTPVFQGTRNKDILQDLKTLFSITAGTVVLDREFGIETDMLSLPMEIAMNDFSVEAMEKVDRYVPRVMVDEVTWDKSDFNQGILTPVINVSENDSYDGDVVTVEDDGHMYDFWVNELEE